MSPRTSIASAVALATVLFALSGCSSDDATTKTTDSTDKAAAKTTTTEDDPLSTDLAAPESIEECVDRMIASLNAINFDDPVEAAAVDGVVSDVVGACQEFDMDELQSQMDERQDELSDAAHEWAYGGADTPDSGLASAAGLPCVDVASALPAGSPEVPMPVGEVPDRLVIEDLVAGDGAEVTADDTLQVDYIGVACSTGEIFDSSYSRGEPAEFPLSGVIPGWSEGLVGMKVGGTRLLVIPANMAYGDAGSPPAIAPGEALVFVVELHDITT